MKWVFKTFSYGYSYQSTYRKPAYAWDQEYIREGSSTEVKLHNLTHKFTTNVWHITARLYLHAWYIVVVYLNIVSNDELKYILWVVMHAPVLVSFM